MSYDGERWFRVPELAELIGVSERTILRAIGRGDLRAKRYLREYRVPAPAVDEWWADVRPQGSVVPLRGRMMRAS